MASRSATATTAVLALAGAALAFATISDDVLEQPGETEGDVAREHHRTCAVAGTPLSARPDGPEPAEAVAR